MNAYLALAESFCITTYCIHTLNALPLMEVQS